jgi:hypothetical protein
LVSDNRIVVATYIQLARDVARIGAYADMMHMYALSAVLRLPIRSYYPPQINPEFRNCSVKTVSISSCLGWILLGKYSRMIMS